MKKRLFKIFALFVMICALLSTVSPVFAASKETVTDIFKQDFNSFRTEKDFSTDGTKHPVGTSFLAGLMQSYNGALRIKSADMRWWNIYYSESYMYYDFTVSFDKNYGGTTFSLLVQNHTPSTTTESPTGGLVVIVKEKDGKPALFDRNGKLLMEFEKSGKAYKVHVEMRYGEDTYSVYVDKKLLSDSCRFVSPMFGCLGLRINSEAGREGSYLTVDDIHFYTKGRSYPQKLSYQEVGPLPSITIPSVSNERGISFWHNGEKIACPVTLEKEEGTVYLPYSFLISAMGEPSAYKLDKEASKISRNGKTVKLNRPVKEMGGELYVPAQFLAEVYDAKVWLDEEHDMLIVTTGKEINDGILRKNGSVYIMNGEPYYEISFNKFDLNYQISADGSFYGGQYPNRSFPNAEACIKAAAESLKQLHENGFKSIRVFCNHINLERSKEEVERFWKITDTMYDLCEKYEIQVVACLGLFGSAELLPGEYLAGTGWVPKSETVYDQVTDPNSESRQNVYDFIDTYVSRYKDRDCILMWEIQNEGNLQIDIGYQTGVIAFSAEQQGNYYADLAERIRMNDPERLISGGDSVLRTAQWHLYAANKRGAEAPDWNVDSREERLKMLMLLNKGMDVISVHGYGVGFTDLYRDESGATKATTWELFMSECERLGLALYNGETAGLVTDNGRAATGNITNGGEKTADLRYNYLETIMDAGVQLSHWWTFHSDRADFGNDVDSFGVRVDDETKYTFEAVKKANEELKKRYVKNGIAMENTDILGLSFANPFKDVNDTDRLYNAIAYVYENGLMIGTAADTFGADADITRAMIVTILYRAAGSPEVKGECKFTDVPENAYYRDPVVWAAENGVVYGVSDTSFAPNSNITREQLAAILYRYTKASAEISPDCDDAENISSYAVYAVGYMIDKGLMSYKSGDSFMPRADALRGDAAEAFYGIFGK